MSLIDLLADALHDNGDTRAAARKKAAQIIEWGAKNGHAGSEHYWPQKARLLLPAERDAGIVSDFTGGNLREVCKKYGVSHTTVYNAIHSARN